MPLPPAKNRAVGLPLIVLFACGPTAAPAPTDASAPTGDLAPADALAPPTDAALDAVALDALAADVPFATVDHAHYPQVVLPDGGTGVVPSARIVSVVAANDALAAQLFDFGDAVVRSAWFRAWSDEYGVGAPGASVHVMGPAITAAMTRAQEEDYVRDAVAASPDHPTPDGHTIYVLYFPDGVFTDEGTNSPTCGVSYHGGYAHSTMGDGIAYVARCTPRLGQTQIDQLTTTSSHEIAEAATDSVDGWALFRAATAPAWMYSVWIEEEGGAKTEVGDICSLDTRITEGAFVYQRIFSNVQAALGVDPCVPHHTVPYYAVTDPQGWYAAPARPASGAWTVAVPLTGWSTAPTSDWIVRASPAYASDLTLSFGALIDSPTTTSIMGATYKTTNNGRTATLSVTLPATATSGDWFVTIVRSERLDPTTGIAPADDDFAHRWLVGVYVP